MEVLKQPQYPILISSNYLYPFNPSLDDEIQRLFADFNVAQNLILRQKDQDIMEEFRHNGHDSEYCPELEQGIVPVPNPRRVKKNKKPLPTECVFCKNNGEEVNYYKQHLLKDTGGRVLCPVLRAYTCPICGANGDKAHTLKYCPENKNPYFVSTVNALKVLRNSTGKRRVK